MQELPVSLYYVFSIRKFSGGCHRSGLHFAGEAYIYVRLASAKKISIHLQLFFPQAQPDFRTFIHLGIHSDLMAQLFQDLPA